MVWQLTTRRDITGVEVLPEEQGDQAPHQVPPAPCLPWGSAPGRQAPITFGFDNQQDFTPAEPECYRKLRLYS